MKPTWSATFIASPLNASHHLDELAAQHARITSPAAARPLPVFTRNDGAPHRTAGHRQLHARNLSVGVNLSTAPRQLLAIMLVTAVVVPLAVLRSQHATATQLPSAGGLSVFVGYAEDKEINDSRSDVISGPVGRRAQHHVPRRHRARSGGVRNADRLLRHRCDQARQPEFRHDHR